jgi:hypothetical protein
VIIPTDRSRIETWEKCCRKRYWQYEYDGTGLQPTGERNLKLDARIGQGVHDGIEFGLGSLGDHAEIIRNGARNIAALAAGYGMGKYMKALADEGIAVTTMEEQQRREVFEGADIVSALVYAWLRLRLPSMLRDGDVLAIERELDMDFAVGEHTVRLMTRPDIVWRRRADGAVFIRNIKTVREPRTTWREQWALDMQTLSEPLAVDKWLADNAHQLGYDKMQYDVVNGVIIDGLVTGSVLDYPRGSGKFYHNTPLLYGWVRKGDAPFGQDEWYPRYEWHCTGPHKMGNGRKCDGDRDHKLSGVTKQSVAANYPGGVLAWIDRLLEEELPLVEEQVIELPPIIRSPYAIERWKRQALRREVDIARRAEEVSLSQHPEIGDGQPLDEVLDYTFPMHTASGNCLRPGQCSCYALCHGAAAADPVGSGLYRVREPHHKQEREIRKQEE